MTQIEDLKARDNRKIARHLRAAASQNALLKREIEVCRVCKGFRARKVCEVFPVLKVCLDRKEPKENQDRLGQLDPRVIEEGMDHPVTLELPVSLEFLEHLVFPEFLV